MLFYQIEVPVLFAANHAYFMWRMGQGHDTLLFGGFFVSVMWVLSMAAKAISAMVAVRVYRGHQAMLALLYTGFVVVRCVAGLTPNLAAVWNLNGGLCMYYDAAANGPHYSIRFSSFPPLGIGTIFYLFPAPSIAALVGGMWAASLREMVARSHQ